MLSFFFLGGGLHSVECSGMGGGCFTNVMLRITTRSALYVTPLDPPPPTLRLHKDHATCRAVIARFHGISDMQESVIYTLANVISQTDKEEHPTLRSSDRRQHTQAQ